MQKSLITTLLLAILLLLSFQTLAETSGGKCGFIANSDMIDGTSRKLCPGNKIVKLKTALYGDMTQIGMVDGVDIDSYESRINSYDEITKQFITKTNAIIGNVAKFIYSWMWIFGVIGLLQLAVKAIFDLASGDFLKRYDFKLLVGVPLIYIAMTLPFTGPGANYGMFAYLQQYYDNGGLQNEQEVMQSNLATRQRAGLEVNFPEISDSAKKQIESSIKYEELIKGKQTYSQAEYYIDGFINKSMFQAMNSRLLNSTFNVKSEKWNVFTLPSVALKNVDSENFEFKEFSPENADKVVYQSSVISVPKSYYKASLVLKALEEIEYESKYGNVSDINQALSTSLKMAQALKNAPSLIGREGEYRATVNTAKTILFEDIRANWMRAKIRTFLDEAFKLNLLTLNAMCASDSALRDSADKFVKTLGREGSVDCVGDDKKALGTQSADSYKLAFVQQRKALVDSLYKEFMSMNTSYVEAMQSDELLKIYEETLDCGALCFMNNYNTISNLTAYSKDVLANFNEKTFMGLYEPLAVGDYLDTEYYENIGMNVDSALKIEAFMKSDLKVVSAGFPSLNADSLIQKAILENGVSGGQDDDLMRGVSMRMRMPHIEFQRMIASNQNVLRSYYIFSQSVLKTGADSLTAALTIKTVAVTGIAALEMKKGNSKADDVATVGKVKKGKGQKSGFNLQKYLVALDGLADLMMSMIMYAVMFAIAGMFLILTVTSYIPVMIYLLSKLYICFGAVFVVFTAITALRSNDMNNIIRIRNNTIAIILAPYITGTVILLLFIVNAEISNIITKEILVLIYQKMSVQFGGNSFNKYIVLILIINVAIYCIQLASLTMMIDMIAISLKRLGLDKHSGFVGTAVSSLDTLVAVLNIMNMGMYRAGQVGTSALLQKVSYRKFIKPS